MTKIRRKAKKKMTPQLMIIISFLAVIVLGTLCLMFPFATKDGKGLAFLDSFFLSISATCVTGLSTISVGPTLTHFGRVIVAIMIEIGGLSFLTIVSFFMAVLGVKMGVNDRNLIKEALNQDSTVGLVKLLKRIVAISLSIQAAGAFCLMFIFLFKYHYSFGISLEYSVFHAISAFNNAGLDIFENGEGSLIYFSGDIPFNIITMILILLGGLGFIVYTDVFSARRWKKLSVHSKIVLITNGALVIFGTLAYKLFFWLQGSGNDITWLEAMFQSVTMRTAGFATFDLSVMESNPAAYITTLLLMFIGASPCSTGGGFKTTTFAILLISIICSVKGEPTHAFRRSISSGVVQKAFVLFSVEMLYLFIVISVMSICEMVSQSGITTNEIVFEAVSAFATVGVSEGITASLSLGSKIVIIITMFIGRLGPLTILSLWGNRSSAIADKEIRFVEGHVIVS